MKADQIVTVTGNKTMLGKRTRGYTAKLVGTDETCGCQGDSPMTAVASLLFNLQQMLRYRVNRRYFFSKSGKTVFCLYYSWGGWAYDIVKPSGTNSPSGCMMNSGTLESVAVESCRKHAEQYED